MRRVWYWMLGVVCWALASATQASTVKTLDVLVKLLRNGDALIEERWDIDVTNSDAKTEWYVAHRNLGERSITDLRVVGFVPGSSTVVPFETCDHWDVDWSREKKTGRCGIHNDEEICWGFGDYGRHEYTVSYRLTKLLQAYDTHDGFNHCFVDMDAPIERARVTLFAEPPIALNDSNTLRWAFGYHGSIEWQGDSLVATPDGMIGAGDGRMILMVQVEKGLFEPSFQNEKKWEDVKARALEDSDWAESGGKVEDTDLTLSEWLLIISIMLAPLYVFILPFLWWLLTLKPLRMYLKRKRLGIVKGLYCRDVNPEWSLVRNANMLQSLSSTNIFFGNSNQEIIGALLLRLVAEGKVSFTEWSKNEKKRKKTCLKIDSPLKEKPKDGASDKDLQQRVLWYLTQASGSDLILQSYEFSAWAEKNRGEMDEFMKLLDTDAEKTYVEANAKDVFGLRDFLRDFTLVGERHASEVALWDEYLVYAQLFGLAKIVAKEMQVANPEYFKSSQLGRSLALVDADYVSNWSSSFYRSVKTPATSGGGGSGHGSRSSFGGGGGFSGGGGGGGR